MVVERLVIELAEDALPSGYRSESLRWLLHGPPGVGKYHVLRLLRELFEKARGYELG